MYNSCRLTVNRRRLYDHSESKGFPYARVIRNIIPFSLFRNGFAVRGRDSSRAVALHRPSEGPTYGLLIRRIIYICIISRGLNDFSTVLGFFSPLPPDNPCGRAPYNLIWKDRAPRMLIKRTPVVYLILDRYTRRRHHCRRHRLYVCHGYKCRLHRHSIIFFTSAIKRVPFLF